MPALTRPHAVLLPFPETGHINPLMQLALYLASHHGFVITFVNTQYNHSRIIRSNRGGLPTDIRLVAIPDGLSEQDNRDNDIPLMVQVMQNVGPVLLHLIKQLNDGEGPLVTCIISDVSAVKTLDVAKELGIPRVAFWPPCFATHAIICHAAHGASMGTFTKTGVLEPKESISFPGIPPLLGSQLPWTVGTPEDWASIFQSLLRNMRALRGSEWTLCNSVHELESKFIELMPEGYPMMCPVGPVLPSDFLEQTSSREKRVTASLWPEEDDCLQWLDTQEPKSVVYVSVGSIAVLNKEQMQELAYGLEASQVPILWVVRPDLVNGTGAGLPDGFLERTKNQIRTVTWAPQLLVLSHYAVGGFLTHCGWNSTIESMSAGVPMVTWPHLADQFSNANLAVEEWGIGIPLDVERKGSVDRTTVGKQVRVLMQGPEGQEVRERAARVRDICVNATKEGGSSHGNLCKFADWVRHRTELIYKERNQGHGIQTGIANLGLKD